MLQQGKGADMGASFGSGGSQTLFGSTGSGNMLSHTTSILVAFFFATSLGLSVLAKHKSQGGAEAGVPAAALIQEHNAAAEQKKDAEQPQTAGDVPVVAPTEQQAAGDVPPALEAVPASEPAKEDVPAAPAPAQKQ
jgi:preprotein translocase subunit SecG